MEKTYDVVVIGAGSGGLTVAVGFAKVGKKVLLVEKEHMGGECTNSGCIPSKALLYHAHQFHIAQKRGGDSDKLEEYRKEALTYVRSVIDSILEEETPETFQKLGIDVVLGEASFTSPQTLQVHDTTYIFSKAVIATGSAPRELSIEGLAPDDVLTNQNLFELEDIPKRLLIIGGGPIGMEMGQAFALLGSEVTIADINDRFAHLEDEAISPIIQKVFENHGVTILLNAQIRRAENKEVLCTIDKKEKRLAYDKVLVAIGRVPQLPNGLTEAGVAYSEHGIETNTQHQTTNKKIYALGDVAQRLKFTHTADNSAREVVTHAVSKGLVRADTSKAVPKVTYTIPEIAQVGLSYQEACKKYGEQSIMRIEVPLSTNDRAKTHSNTTGLLVVLVRRLSGTILGAHTIGPRSGELIALFTLAIDQKLSLWKLRNTIFAYPTYALLIKKAGDYFFAQQLADLKKDILHLCKKHIAKVLVGLVWAVAVWQLYAYKNAHGMDTTETALMVFDFITMTIWGPVLYVLIYAVRPLTFFPATALTILSGIFFGFWGGLLLTILAANLSAAVAYMVGRFFGKGLSLENSVFGTWITRLREHTFATILTMRLIFLPFDGVSYLAGVLKASFVPFVVATFLGILLGSATFVSIGASLDIETFRNEGFSASIIDVKFLLFSALIFCSSIFISRLLKRKQH